MLGHPKAMSHPSPEEEVFRDAAEERTDEDAAPRALQRYFAMHNRQALTLAFLSLGVSTVLWAITYVLVFWFSLVAATLSRSFNPATLVEVTDRDLLTANFSWWFAGGAAVALIVAGIVRKRVRLAKLREARLYLLWVIVELFMAIPNMTFAVFGNLSAITRLRRKEAAQAWKLLQRINHEGGRMNVAFLRQEIDDEKVLRRVMFGLQLVGLTSLRESQQEWFLYLQNRDAFAALLSHAHGAA